MPALPSPSRPLRLIAIGLLLSLLGPTAFAFGVPELTALLQRHSGGVVSYREQQFRRVLTRPVEQQGELAFTPPDQFEKRVITPRAERYLITGDTLTIETAGRQPRQLSLRSQPLLSSLLLSFQAVVSGDLPQLADRYQVAVSGEASGWQLQLTPRDASLARVLRSITVTGVAGELQRMEVIEASGDRILTTLGAAHVGH